MSILNQSLKTIWHKIFPETTGQKCIVIARCGSDIELLPGIITDPTESQNKELTIFHAGNITYEWTDKTKHTFLTDLDKPAGFRSGIAVYTHTVGSLYSSNVTKEFVDSDFYNKILESRDVRYAMEYLREYHDAQNIPWIKYAIWAGVAILIILAWKSGLLNALWSEIRSVIPTDNPIK